jgi:hypothetical protein
MRHAILTGLLLAALLALVSSPPARADDSIYGLADNPVYAMKGGNGYFYIFYRDTSNNIRYQYYDGTTWSTSSIIVSGNVNGDDDFVVGFYGLTYVLILYQQFVTGNKYDVYVLKCTVAAPLSCGTPVKLSTASTNTDVQELALTYNPSGGRWYAGYVYYSDADLGYEYITFRSTDGSTWASADNGWPGSPIPGAGFRFHVTAIPGTTDAFAFTSARVDEGFYRYCIVIVGAQGCSTNPYTIGSKTAGSVAPPMRGIPSTSSGRAEIFTNNQWFRCTSSSCTTGTVGSATWNDPVSLMRDGSSIYMFYMSSNLVKRRTVTTSVGSEITYLVAPSGQAKYGVGVPIEATTPRPVAYLAGSSLYIHTEPTSFTVTIPQTLTASDTVYRVAGYTQTITETLTASDTVDRLINYVRGVTELVGLSDYFAGSPAFTLPELVQISDIISYELVSQGEGGGGGGGGGPAAPSQPAEPPSVEIPVEPVPARPIAIGSAVVAGILLVAFTAMLVRGRGRAVDVWRRRRARARRIWR